MLANEPGTTADLNDASQAPWHDPARPPDQRAESLLRGMSVEEQLEPGEQCDVTFRVHADLSSFTGLDGRRIVEPGELELRLGSSCADIAHTAAVTLTGPARHGDHTRRMTAHVEVTVGAAEKEATR